MQHNLIRYFILILLLILFALLSFGARRLSFTYDEPAHIAAGYAFLSRGATWLVPQRGHPLLVDAWEALPFYMGHPDIPLEDLDGWGQDKLSYIEAFTPFLTRAMERSEIATRTPATLLTLLLAAIVYRWGADLWGRWSGLLASGILTFDPTLLAHGRLATNDVGVTTLGTLGLYLLWRWTQAPSWRKSVFAGVSLGLTMLAKGSGVLWAAVGLSWSLWFGLRKRGNDASIWRQAWVMSLLALLIVWSMYGFTVGPIPGWLAIPIPAPRHWMAILHHADPTRKHTIFALGQLKTKIWPGYFPLAFLIKNPVPLLIGLFLAVGVRWRKLKIPGFFSILYVIVAVTHGPNIGYRHMLPVHPFLYLLIAGGIGWLWQHLQYSHRLLRSGRWFIAALGIWYVACVMLSYPYNLSFFNCLIGGAANGGRYLANSNTDWGQGWKALRDFQKEQSLIFDYSGPEGYAEITPYELWDKSLPPLNYVSEPLPSPWLFPTPGEYVISANTLSGLRLVDPDNFAWFRYHAPDTMISNSLFYYHVDESLSPTWLAQCTIPVTPLNEDAIAEGFGEIDLRTIAFDCSQSWVYPDSGKTRGVYALHETNLRPATLKEKLYLASARPVDSFAARRLRGVQLAYRQWEYRTQPAFALYEWETYTYSPPPLMKVKVAPADMPSAVLTATTSHTTPVILDGPFNFLGAAIHSQEEKVEIETWWHVTEPITRPLSVMAHLVDEDGAVLGIADGFGISPLALKTGDVMVQRHSFPALTENVDTWLRTGAYWLDTKKRWSVMNAPESNVLIVPLKGKW